MKCGGGGGLQSERDTERGCKGKRKENRKKELREMEEQENER